MTKKEKLLQKARENPDNLTFDEFETLLNGNLAVSGAVIVYGVHLRVNLYPFNRVEMVKQNYIKSNNSWII
jgi:hypothetical protein